MPICKIITAHPAHLDFLSQVVDGGESATPDALRRAVRVMNTLEETAEKARVDLGNENAIFVDPTQVRTDKDWEVRKKIRNQHGELVVDENSVYLPKLRVQATLAADEFEHVEKVFGKLLAAKSEAVPKRLLLALQIALDGAEKVTLDLPPRKE